MPHTTDHKPERSAVEAIGDEVRESVHMATYSVKKVGAAVAQQTHDGVELLREKAADYSDQGREMAIRFGRTLDNQVRSQPVKSLLVAAGIGLAVGLLLTRRR